MSSRMADAEAIVKRAEQIGWEVEPSNDGWKIKCADGVKVQVHRSYSDHRSLKNLMGELRKHGFAEALATHETAEAAARKERLAADRARAADKAAAQAEARLAKATAAAAVEVAALPGPAGPLVAVQPTLMELLTPTDAPRTYEHVLVTQEMAALMMERNDPKNRPLRRDWVQRWIQIMKKGKWLYTHQGVAFNTRGLIQDAQHRLAAVAESGIACEFQVSVGMPDENFKVLDTGNVRSAAAVLGMAGEQYGVAVAAAARLIALYDQWGATMLEHSNQKVSNIDLADLVATLHRDDLNQALSWGRRLRGEVGGGVGGPVAAFYLLLGAVPRDCAPLVEYAEDLILGVRDEGDPAHVVRRRLVRSSTGKTNRLSTAEGMVLIIKGWNARVTGRTGTSYFLVRSTTVVPTIVVPK